MADVKVVIDIVAQDSTGNVTSGVQKKITALEKTVMGLSKKLEGLTKGKKASIEIDANDHATDKLSDVEGAAHTLDGISSQVTIETSGDAIDIIEQTIGAADELNGMGVQASLEADDHATDTILWAADALEEFGGMSEEAQIEVDDMATDVILVAVDSMDEFGGMSETAEIEASDQATDIIHSAENAAEDFAKTYTAKLEVIDNANQAIDAAASNMLSRGKGVVTGIAGLMGAGMSLGSSVDTFDDFESTMSLVKAVSGAMDHDFEKLISKAQEMGATTKFTATEAAEAFNYMGMAGWDASEMLDGIAPIMNLAAASGEELGLVSDIVTDSLTAFGKGADQAGHFADVLAQASSASNTNVGMMGETFKYAGAMAGALGYSIDDVGIAAGLMANAGIKSSMAGTSLRSFMTRLSTDTDGAREAFDSLTDGMTTFFDKETGKAIPLLDVMTTIREATKDMDQEERIALANKLAGTTGEAGLLAILNASEEDFEDLVSQIEHANGTAERMKEIMLDNMKGSLTLMNSAIDATQMTLGARLSPYIRDAADYIAKTMPSISNSIDKFFNGFDAKVKHMTSGKKWGEANLFGKINIAWDELIGKPFTDWASGDGMHMVSQGITEMFKGVGRTVSGSGGITDWLETAVVAKGALSLLSKFGPSIAGTVPWIGSFATSLGAIAPAAVGAAAALAVAGAAIDSYNQKEINKSLSDHFGNMELSADELVQVADHVINAQYLVHANAVLESVSGIETIRTEVEGKLKENDKITWKASLGMEITNDEVNTYIQNEKDIIDAKLKILTDEQYTAKILINVAPDTETSKSVSSQMGEWIKADNLEFSSLQNQITEKLGQAFHDGIADLDILAEVDSLQAQMDELLNAWNLAQSQAAHDMLEMKFGSMSAEQLSAGGFKDLVDQIHTTLLADQDVLDGETQSYLALLNSFVNSKRIDEATKTQLQNEWQMAERNERAGSIVNALGMETNTLNNAYGEQIQRSTEAVNRGINASIEGLSSRVQNGQMGMIGTDMEMDVLNSNAGDGKGIFGWTTNADQSALNDIWSTMKPTAQMMSNLVDEYVKAGQGVPQALKDGFNEAMALGAAAGDVDATWQMYANSIAESGDEELIKSINEIDAMGSLPEQFSKAWARASQEVDLEPLTLDGAKAELNDVEVDSSGAQAAIEDAMNLLTAEGAEFSVTADGVQVDLSNVEVDSATAMSQIEAALGMEAGSLEGAGIEVESGATVTIPADMVTADTSGIAVAVQEEADTAFSETIETEGSTDVELTQTNNVDAIYSEVDGEVTSKFGAGFTATAPVTVTLDWHIANANASINVSTSGLNATATIAGYSAYGRYVDSPMLSWIGEDGPEFVIPVGSDKRDRGMELWQAAGEALGVGMNADGGAYGPSSALPSSGSGEGSSTPSVPVTVNVNSSPVININGSGRSEESIIETVRKNLSAMSDQMAGEIADRIEQVFGNMIVCPV